jgi:hypothetical protein
MYASAQKNTPNGFLIRAENGDHWINILFKKAKYIHQLVNTFYQLFPRISISRVTIADDDNAVRFLIGNKQRGASDSPLWGKMEAPTKIF